MESRCLKNWGTLALLLNTLATVPTWAEPIVEVVGIRDCAGILSEQCGWQPYLEPPPEVESPGGIPVVVVSAPKTDDGSRGKAMGNNRFTPGCDNEYYFMEDTIARVVGSNEPVGERLELAGGIGDPLYNDGNWEKYEIGTIKRISSPGEVTMRFEIRIHYMFNQTTNQIAQVKLKNSFESGCIGFASARS